MSGVGGLRVTGGRGGIAAGFDEMERMAAVFAEVGADLLSLGAATHRVLADADLLASALVAPAGVARVQGALLAALDGPGGLTAAAGRLQLRAVDLAAAVARYRAADELGDGAADVRRHVQGAVSAHALPLLVPAGMVAGAGWGAGTAARGEQPIDALQRLLTEHPWLVDEIAGSSPGFVAALSASALGPARLGVDAAFRAHTGQTLVPGSLGRGAGLLALLYPPGGARVTRVAARDRTARRPPVTVADLVLALHEADRAALGDTQGHVDVRRIVTAGPGGVRSAAWIVTVPGTKDWQLDPRRRAHLNDLATNLTAFAGARTARVDGLARALQDAGARPGQPVMLVGHSQGGILALRAAEEWSRDGSFDVSHVVTAGSPVARIEVPATVAVLSLENRHDLVPRLDARPNPDLPHWTTVEFAVSAGDADGNHGVASAYLPGADALSTAPDVTGSVQAWLRSAQPFLAGPGEVVTVERSVYDIRNSR